MLCHWDKSLYLREKKEFIWAHDFSLFGLSYLGRCGGTVPFVVAVVSDRECWNQRLDYNHPTPTVLLCHLLRSSIEIMGVGTFQIQTTIGRVSGSERCPL